MDFPTDSGIHYIGNRFEKSGLVEGRRPYQHGRSARTRANVAAVHFHKCKIQLTHTLNPTDPQ